MPTEPAYCHRCHQLSNEIVGGICIQCRCEVDTDERSVTQIISSVMFPKPKPQKKSSQERREGIHYA